MFPGSGFFGVTLPHLRRGSLTAVLLLLFAFAALARGQKISSADLITSALASNAELQAVRLTPKPPDT